MNEVEPPVLDGLRVLDFGRLMPSGVATFELAQMGADVIKVEIPPVGDYIRDIKPAIRGRGDIHLSINRNKRSISVDFRTPGGRDIALQLIRDADVMVELSRPGTMAKYGLSWEDVRAVNPKLVYCSFTAYGDRGPMASLPAHGLSADAAGGALTAGPDGNYSTPDSFRAVGPWAAGLYGASRIVAACYSVRLGSSGRRISVSQLAAAAACNYREMAVYANEAEGSELTFAGLGPRYAAYECEDHEFVLLCATEAPLWNAFCEAVDRTDLPDYQRDDYLLGYGSDSVLGAELTRLFQTRSSVQWMQLAIEKSLSIAPVRRPDELHVDSQLQSIGMISETQHPLDGGPVHLAGDPAPFDEWAPTSTPAPELGQHTAEVLSSIGYSAHEIDDLARRGVVTVG